MRVGEGRQDAEPAEVDDIRARKRCFVHANAAGDIPARDRKCPRGGEGRLHRPDDAVLEDHRR
jgi:hypothetical protein